MRVAAWNLNHRTLEKHIPTAAIEGIQRMRADVLILTEFVDGLSRASFKAALHKMGYTCISVSGNIAKNNQILIASKAQHVLGDLKPPDTTDAAVTNFLHLVFPDYNIEIVGIRPPAYKSTAEVKDYWNKLSDIMFSAKGRAIIFMGDFNCDPFHGTTQGAKALRNLLVSGFSIPEPEGAWSYISHDGLRTSQIDHAVITPQVGHCTASYLSREGGIIFAGPANLRPISDHAVLVLDTLLQQALK